MLHIGNRYFINVESLSSNNAAAWNLLSRHRKIRGSILSHVTHDSCFMAQLTVPINQGYLYFQ
ncbi:hypothetical protein [Candidatus Williamhamiltonella defendens]|uniref:hypothetical protein n=1 Tax=Candidatus Williamhamiltonella defendens TaxID=138072 RepID=UPI00387EDA9D